MRMMGQLVQRNRPCSEIMARIAADDAKNGPYVPCSCGSGKKFRFCHGNRAPESPFSGINAAPQHAPPVYLQVPPLASSGNAHGGAE
jgi:uncharacterized protein